MARPGTWRGCGHSGLGGGRHGAERGREGSVSLCPLPGPPTTPVRRRSALGERARRCADLPVPRLAGLWGGCYSTSVFTFRTVDVHVIGLRKVGESTEMSLETKLRSPTPPIPSHCVHMQSWTARKAARKQQVHLLGRMERSSVEGLDRQKGKRVGGPGAS
ncbi:hypothetical protein HJG60_009166 [Phyllostomus discolor]|uniref:Uncharacterized protein n=1 Tax=Phyllostomus discolor TaxID=89673 RepID=A0A833YSE6_9CHIR|nr:hypothetical protein HJG60_009166 [Phyllostomus discolor]